MINLKELYGEKFRLDVEESYYAENPKFRKQEEPWLTYVVCVNGSIGVWGDDLLVACTKTNGAVASRLKVLPYTEVAQEGSDGVNVTFNIAHFDDVAKIMKPKRRRRLSEEQKAANLKRLARHQF